MYAIGGVIGVLIISSRARKGSNPAIGVRGSDEGRGEKGAGDRMLWWP